jgi:MYXO-CTERM domain-containing protein
LLATFVTGQNWNSVFSNPVNASNTVTFSSSAFAQNYDVIFGASYWLVVSTTSGSAKAWGVSSVLDGPTASYSSSTSTWGSISLSGALGASVSVSAIPEPVSSVAVAGLFAVGLVAFRRRRAQRKA